MSSRSIYVVVNSRISSLWLNNIPLSVMYIYIHLYLHCIFTFSPFLLLLSFKNTKVVSVSSVQLFSHVRLFATPWTAAREASLSITNSWSLPKLMSIESVMPSNHLILCHPLLLPPSVFTSIRVFSSESALCIRWPKYVFTLALSLHSFWSYFSTDLQ